MFLCCCPGQVKMFTATDADSLHTSVYYIIYLHCSSGEVRTFTATDSESAYTDNLDKLCPASSRLHLKVGAQVCTTLDVCRAELMFSLVSLAAAATSIIFVVTKLLSEQNYVCHDKHVFFATNLLS